MLTVRIIAQDGMETIVEAEHVEVVRTGDRFNDGIYLDRNMGGPVIGPQTSVGNVPSHALNSDRALSSYKHVIHFVDARSSEDRETPRVFVMNRFGATVAKYNL